MRFQTDAICAKPLSYAVDDNFWSGWAGLMHILNSAVASCAIVTAGRTTKIKNEDGAYMGGEADGQDCQN